MTWTRPALDPALVVRAGALYVPLTMAGLLAMLRRPGRSGWAGILLASVWNFEALAGLGVLAPRMHWWSFQASGGIFLGTPVDLLLGWVALWGVAAPLAFPKTRLAAIVAVLATFDVIFMPRLGPVLQLGPRWLVGECAALLVALMPSQFFERATRDGTHLEARTLMQVAVFSGLIVVFLPAAIFANAGGNPWQAFARPTWVNGMLLQLVALTGVLGLSAVQEFVERGGGTPLPYDPPAQLVTSGPYAYVANPMQLSATLLLMCWGMFLGSWWVAAAGVMAHIYSAGLAAWDESGDVEERFGAAWREYRKHVRCWIPRWRPWHASVADGDIPGARLYVAETCGPCSEVKAWFERRNATGLAIVAAESYPGEALKRITYVADPGAAPEAGIAALARSIAHIHLGWAMVGFAARLPVVRPLLQLLADASGAGQVRGRGGCRDC